MSLSSLFIEKSRFIGFILCVVCQTRAWAVEDNSLLPKPSILPWLVITNKSPIIVDRYSNPPDDLVEIVGGGPFISFAGLPGHLPGDSERTLVEIRASSHAGSDVEETSLDVEMKDDSGLTYLWLPAHSYPAGASVANNKAVFETDSACRSAVNGPGPNSTVPELDGTCSWHFRNIDNDGKSAALLSGIIGKRGGKLWGQAVDVIAEKGSMGSDLGLPGGLMIGQEIDTGNFAKRCPVTPSDCLVVGMFLAGFSEYPGTAGILGGGQPVEHPLYHEGVTLLPHFASDVAFNDDSSADVGFQSNGVHRNYTFQDKSSSPTSINIGGEHSFAGVFDAGSTVAFFSGGRHAASSFYDESLSGISLHVKGTHALAAYYDDSVSTVGIELQGSYKQQILANGFNVDALGHTAVESIKTRSVHVADLQRCDFHSEGTFSSVIDAQSMKYLAKVEGGGHFHLPVFCDGSAWVAH